MIKYLAGLRPQTLDDVLLRSQTLQAATEVAKETTVEAQVRRNSWGGSSKRKQKFIFVCSYTAAYFSTSPFRFNLCWTEKTHNN